MFNVLRSYFPFFVWLFLVAAALRPSLSAASEAGSIDAALEPVQSLLAGAIVPKKPARIGYVAGGAGPTLEAFRQGLREAGYSEGRDVILETRFSDGKPERFPALIAELLARPVDVLVAGSPPGALAALRTDTSVPIVTAGVADAAGIARRLGRPAAHVTGTTLPTSGIASQWLPFVKGMKPGVKRVAVLTNPANPSRETWMRDIRESAQMHDVRLAVYDVGSAAELERTLAAIRADAPDALFVTGDPVFLTDRAKIVAFAADCELPAAYFSKLFADAGGLIAYGPSLEDSYRRAPAYVARILRGAKPAELPIEAARVELVVNLRTAKALGVTVPRTVLERADALIE